MPEKAHKSIGTEELVQLFNDQMFSENCIDFDDLMRDLRAFKVSVEQVFPHSSQV
ncbi:MAG: hypothetical protein GPJ52_04515 [Candidatus Heimdallarchaeota archaeon]|nr:hypothetical protein [Candidatus Heimdallarchaeota archaeon]